LCIKTPPPPTTTTTTTLNAKMNIQVIVDALNAPPFNKDLSLVLFDEKTPFELLQVLNEVMAHLDKRHDIEIRDEPQEETGSRMIEFIRLLKFPGLPNSAEQQDQFALSILQGNRNAIYPVLHYMLSKLPQLEKRAYLAKYLVNIEVPQQFMLNSDVSNVYNQYKSLRSEFAETHKTVDRLRQNSLAPGELRKEIVQLEEEKHQLVDKIDSLKRKTNDMRGFEHLLKVTSALRHEQEVYSKLEEQKIEQGIAYEASEQRYKEAQKKLSEMRQLVRDGAADPGRLLDTLRNEQVQLDTLCNTQLPREITEQHEKLAQLQHSLLEPVKTKAELMEVQSTARRLRDEVDHLRRNVEHAQSKRGDDPLIVFRQQAALIAKKREQAETKLLSAEKAKNSLSIKLTAMQNQVQQITGGNQRMSNLDFKKYAVTIREKATKYKKYKAKLAVLHSESVVLNRTEAILKSRCDNLEEVMANIERSKGVEGYTSTQKTLEVISNATAALNSTKGKTLEEISKIVTDINHAVTDRKKKLQPLINKLKGLRPTYKEKESEYLEAKSVFENMAAGLESERVKLERDCESYQVDCQREESRYHMLNCMTQISNSNMERVRLEEQFSRGNGELLPQFRSFQDLYNSKIQQQQSLSQELRKHQNALRQGAPQDTAQRKIFENLRRLLEQKAESVRNGDSVSQGSAGSGALAKGIDATFDAYGGTNIMTLNEQYSP
jgi:intraflagellar transport protein 81